MITREEFISLYKKDQTGQCSDAEKELLESYNDEIKLLGDDWDEEETSKPETANRIWENLLESRDIRQHKPRYQKLFLIKIAAALFLVTSVGLAVLKFSGTEFKSPTPTTTKVVHIPPGGNKAYLTTAGGIRIALNDAKVGALPSANGISIHKTKEGTLVYNAGNPKLKDATEWNTITTPRAGQYHVVLADGSEVWLNAASSLRFPAAFKGNTRQVELTGEAYFEIAKNKAKPFTVKTDNLTINVLGTHFNVNAYRDDGEIKTTLLEGAVQLQHGNIAAKLLPGQQGITTAEGFIISKADIEEAMAWKNGYFVFRDESITTLMKRVARWYDVDVDYKDDMKDKGFGGTVSRYKEITELLDYMQLTGAIHYKLEGRRVIIMK